MNSVKESYEKLKRYYENNNLYEEEQATAYYSDKYLEPMKGLRTVVNRSVEFYVSKVLQNPQVTTPNERVKEAIEQVWKWSNFYSQKSLALRSLSLYGDLFIKVIGTEDKVYFEVIDTELITDFTLDSRGYLTEIRIDIPVVVDEKPLTHTEYWNKEYYSIWEHSFGREAKLDTLSDPLEYGGLTELGIDFIPIVNIKFKNTGDKYGAGSVKHCLDKIDEANRQSTRLHQMLFRYNKPLFVASANSTDKDGRPVPAPKVNKGDNLEITDNAILSLPGTSTLSSLIPDIDYDAALNILNAMMDEIREDLPELNYYSLKEGNLSGKAIKLLLAGALDRASEAEDNLIRGMVRVDEMALTLGNVWSLFRNIGSYENSDFDHDIQVDESFPVENDEKAITVKTLKESGMALKTSMRLAGFSQEDIVLAVIEAEEERSLNENSLANSLMKFNQG